MVRLVQGYSRDDRSDLNQVILELIAESEANLPLLMMPLSGNASDKTSFATVIEDRIEGLKVAGVETVVMDNAGFPLRSRVSRLRA